MTFHDFLKYVRAIPSERGGANIFFVEDAGYQKAAIQEMERALLPVVPMRPTTDKRSRLQTVAPLIMNAPCYSCGQDARNCSGRSSISAWRATMTLAMG